LLLLLLPPLPPPPLVVVVIVVEHVLDGVHEQFVICSMVSSILCIFFPKTFDWLEKLNLWFHPFLKISFVGKKI
jgi:hypothetical protein